MPLVGVLSKGDTVTVLIKHTDEVYELRKVAKIDTLLETIKKIDGRITDLVGSANVVIKNLGQEVSASLYKALDNVKFNNNRYALATGYDTIFASAFDDLADEAKELYDLSPTAVQQAYRKAILESTDMTGKVVKSEDEITEAGRKAIADEKVAVLAGKGGSYSKPLVELNIDSQQLGKKWGKHKYDHPELSSYTEYEQFAKDIFNNPDKIILDSTNGEYFYIKGNDLLRVTLDGDFISLYPGADTALVNKALEGGGLLWEK